MAKRNNIMTVIIIFIVMVLMAAADNVRGVFIPAFKKDFLVSNTSMGLMLAVCSMGYIISTYIGGILCEKIGQKKVMIVGFIFAGLSSLSLFFSTSFTMLLIGLFFLNIGASLLAISINTLIPVIAVSFQAVLMNLIHFCYGAGATITQRTAGILLYSGISWRYIYLAMGFIFFIVLSIFFFTKIPEPNKAHNNEKVDNRKIFKNKILYFYMIALGLYVTAELSTGNWFVNFLKEVYRFNDNMSTFYTALFFGIFTIGRLIGGFVVEKFGHIRSVLVSLVISFILYTIGLIIGRNGVLIISISGLFFGITFPTLVLTITSVFKNNSAYVTGIIITVASAINMVMNFFIGWLNDIIGVYNAFYIIPISLLISSIFTYLIYVNTLPSLKDDKNTLYSN